MRGVISVTGRAAALSRQQPMRSAGRRRPWPSGMLLHHARSVAAPAVAGRAAACLATAAAIILIGASAAPAGALAGGWSVTPSPNPRVPTGQLFWVSCPTAHSCMAVGTYVKASGRGVNLAEQWNGTSWRILPTPNPAGIALSGLFGVTCTAPSACTAVGATTTTTGAVRAVAERWNGGTWSLQPTPSPAGGGALNSVSCTSPSACTAVGGRADGTTLAERWNGTRWSIQPTRNPSQGGATLSGVSCMSASACTAVGGSNAFTPNARTLAERWNGTSWSIQPPANSARAGGVLASVACPTSSGCTAVGASNAGTLAEGWNGTGWSIQPTPTPAGAQSAFLNSVSCTSSSACTAAGAYANSSGTPQTLAEHWDGASWHRQATPNQGPSFLIGLACASAAACTAVGYSNTNQSPAVLVERSAGTTWRTQAAPNPPGAASSFLNSVSCTSRSACVTVGFTTTRSRTVATLAELWNGRTWHIQRTPSPAPGGARNGVRWRIQATPNPAGGGFLNSVSCAARSACTAVGNSGNGRTLAERWNGTRWSIQPTPTPAGAQFAILSSVACTSLSACMAVGTRFDNSGNAVGTLAEVWNGRAWRIVPTLGRTGQDITLNGVSCTSSSACTAVGSSGTVTTLAERWNGHTWRIQPTPGLVTFDIGTPGVACPTSSACFAVASDTNNGPNLTLAEQWNGTTAGNRPTISRLAAQGGSALACMHSPLNMAAYAWPLNHAQRWHSSSAQGLLNRASSIGPATLGWCPAM